MAKMRQRTKQILIGVLSGAAVPTVLLGSCLIYNHIQNVRSTGALERQYQNQIKQIQETSAALSTQGWVLNREIKAGRKVEKQDLTEIELPKLSVPGNYLTSQSEIVGKAAKIDLSAHTLLTQSLLYSEAPTTSDLRNREMSFVQLPGSLSVGDVIDIRIQFPTGEDYILLSKKKVLTQSSPTIGVTLNEGEILSLSSAIVDAYLHKASIYALTYVEPGLQEKAIPTYPANRQVMQLITRDPNIVKKAEVYLNNSSRELLERGLIAMSPQSQIEFASTQATVRSKEQIEPEFSPSQSSTMSEPIQDHVDLGDSGNP